MNQKYLKIFIVVFVVLVFGIGVLLFKLNQGVALNNNSSNPQRTLNPDTSSPANTTQAVKVGSDIVLINGKFTQDLKVEGGLVVDSFTPDGKTGTIKVILTPPDGSVGYGKFQTDKTVFSATTSKELISLVIPGKRYQLRVSITLQSKATGVDAADKIKQMQTDTDLSGKDYFVMPQTIAELE